MTDQKSEASDVEKLFKLTIGDTSQIMAVALGIVYICGFIVVTAYLGSFGIKDYEAFHTQYIISGATLLLVLGAFYYFIVQKILSLDEEALFYEKQFENLGGPNNIWKVCGFLFPTFSLGVSIVVATLITTSILFTLPSTRVIYMIAPLAWGVFFYHTTMTSAAIKHAGKVFFILVEIFYLLVVLAFFALADGILLDFFIFAITVTFLAIVYADTYKSVVNKKAFISYSIIFALVSCSGYFGKNFYGYVRSAIGGGNPESIRVVIDDSNTPDFLKKELQISESVSSKFDLIAQTESELFLGYPFSDEKQGYKTLIRIDRKLIKAIISTNLPLNKYIKAE